MAQAMVSSPTKKDDPYHEYGHFYSLCTHNRL